MRVRGRPKNWRAAAVLCVLAVLVAGCASNEPGHADAGGIPPAPKNLVGPVDPALKQKFPAAIQAAGVLRLGADPSYPPSTFKDNTGAIVGTLPDLAAAITSRAGLKIQWVEVPFDGMLGGLQADRFDVSWSAWSVTAERTQVLNLVAYVKGGTSMLVRAGNPAGIKTAADLCGRTVSAQTGTTQAQQVMDKLQADCAASGKPKIEMLQLPQQTNVNQSVATGRADALLADNKLVGYQAQLQPGVFEAVPGILIQPVKSGVAVPKDKTQLANALAAAFDAIIADGTYGEILARWQNADAAMPQAEINPVGT
jgi:polar amino acid transport system substrate-binding protein